MALLDLPMLPKGDPVCPAGERVRGVTTYDGGCVCRIMQRDQQDEPGVGMSAGQLGETREATGGVYLTVKSDPGTVTRLCWGAGLPSMSSDDDSPHDSYTHCPVWQQRREQDWKSRRALTEPVQPDGVSMGVPLDDPAPPTVDDLKQLAPLAEDARR